MYRQKWIDYYASFCYNATLIIEGMIATILHDIELHRLYFILSEAPCLRQAHYGYAKPYRLVTL